MAADKPAREKPAASEGVREKSAPKQKPAEPVFTDQQRAELRDLFENVYVANKWRIVRLNFLRGVAFGFGTFLGGTIVVAILIYVLTHMVDLFPPIRDFTERLVDSLQK